MSQEITEFERDRQAIIYIAKQPCLSKILALYMYINKLQ